MNRLARYLISALSASACYLICFDIQNRLTSPQEKVSVLFQIGLALFFLIVEGAGLALVILISLWPLVELGYRRISKYGAVYFSGFGALGMLLLGSAASSLAPKPLFIEDQTFFEGFKIAAERQGWTLLLAGMCFGLTFWMSAAQRREPA